MKGKRKHLKKYKQHPKCCKASESTPKELVIGYFIYVNLTELRHTQIVDKASFLGMLVRVIRNQYTK
jgi:hypothetical protein